MNSHRTRFTAGEPYFCERSWVGSSTRVSLWALRNWRDVKTLDERYYGPFFKKGSIPKLSIPKLSYGI